MATILLDGFDDYGPVGLVSQNYETLLNAGGWTYGNVYLNCTAVASLNGEAGYALAMGGVSYGGGGILSQTLTANYNRLIGGFRFEANLLSNVGIAFVDENTTQFYVLLEVISGFVIVQQGNGTQVTRSSGGIAANTVHYLEFDITFEPGSTGGVTVWLDGVQVLQWTGKTAQSANAWANMVQFVNQSSSSGSFTIDDFYLFNSAGGNNNSVCLSNPVVITQPPIGDEQKQFTNAGNLLGYSYALTTGQLSVGANSLYLIRFVAQTNCNLTSVVLNTGNNSSVTANLRGVVYADSSGVPGALIEGGIQVTGFGAWTTLTLPLTASAALTAGTAYWIGFINDTGLYLQEFDNVSITGTLASASYSSGPPSTAPTMTYNQPSVYIYGKCSGALNNWESVALNPSVGNLSYVSASTAGLSDLYSFANLPTNIQKVYAVGVKGAAALSVAGTHTIDLLTKSGSTTSAGSTASIELTTSYASYVSYFDTDPNTSTNWTVSGVNNSVSGMSVAS